MCRAYGIFGNVKKANPDNKSRTRTEGAIK